MICEGSVTIGGFTSEKIDGKKILQSVFILDIEKSNYMEVTVADNIDKEKLSKELLNYYRKEVIAYINITNCKDKPDSNYVVIRFVGIKEQSF